MGGLFAKLISFFSSSELLFQQLRHLIGMARVLQPEIAGEQAFELSGDEAHLGGELHTLLPEIEEILGCAI